MSCNPGYYMPLNGSSRCDSCSPGYFTTVNSRTSCNSCPVGTFKNESGKTSCTLCQPGKYQPNVSSSQCLYCDLGTYQSLQGSTACIACPSSTYSSATGASQCTACSPCQQGFFQLEPCKHTANRACEACTPCLSGQFAISRCAYSDYAPQLSHNNICSSCTVCPRGQYSIGACLPGDNIGDGTQDTLCAPCPSCANNTFLSDGCWNNAPPMCSPCSSCPGPVLFECTPMSDTVCADVVSCRKHVGYAEYPWILDEYRCPRGQYLLGISSITKRPSCAECPAGLYGPNGLWCDYCPGYKVPYFDASMCVCHPTTLQNSQDQCVCGPARSFTSEGCLPCPPNHFQNLSLVLVDEWWTQNMSCFECGAGYFAEPGSSACKQCPAGFYREYLQPGGCTTCPQPDHFALDPAFQASCTPCNTTCALGTDPLPCPSRESNPSLLYCGPCPDLPPNAALAGGACNWECLPGFYRANETYCEPCNSTLECEPGYNLTSCTDISNAHCDNECTDTTKPIENSEWTQGCAWRCKQGYSFKQKNYILWTQSLCVEDAAQTYWDWG